MSNLLELLGKGLEQTFLELVLPGCLPLTAEEAELLSSQVRSCPEHSANLLRLAIHYSQNGSFEQAEGLFEKILKQHSGHLDTRLAWAAMHSSDGNLNEAAAQLQQAYQFHPNDSRVLFGLGMCAERAGQQEKGIELYSKAAKCRPYLRQPRQRLAAIYLQSGDFDNAIQQCQAASEEHPEDVCLYLFLGQLFLQTEEYERATEVFERALTIEPDNFELHNDYVESLAQSGRHREAIEQMHKTIEQQGEFPDNFLRLGDLYSQVGNDEQAVQNYHRALEIHPGYLEAAVKLGTQHLRMGRFCEAAANFNQAVEINDQLITAYVGLGVAQKYSGREEASADTLELAAALEPNTNLLFAEMARLQLKVALAQKAQKEFLPEQDDKSSREMDQLLDLQIERHRQGLRENPNHADLHYRYGLLLRGKGRNDEAIKCFRQALEINPSYIKAKIKLGISLRDRGDLDEGIEQLCQALEIKPEYADLHYKLALMYCDRIQFALAVEHFELALDENPDNTNIHANLALALQNMGLIDRARASWRAVCELEPQSPMAFQAQRELIGLKTVQ